MFKSGQLLWHWIGILIGYKQDNGNIQLSVSYGKQIQITELK